MIPTSVLIKLATLGLSEQQAEAIGVMLSQVETATREASEAVVEKSREKARARLQKWKDKQPENVSKRSATSPSVSQRLTRVEDSSSKLEIDGKERKKVSSTPQAAFTPRQELETVLDAERAKAVIDHRQRIGKPLTAHAAKLLAHSLAKWHDANEAADAMVENGWQGFKTEWLENRQTANPRSGTGPPRRQTALEALHEISIERGWIDEPASPHGNHVDARVFPAEPSRPKGAVVDFRGGIAGRIR